MSYLNDIEKLVSSDKWDYYECHNKKTIRGILQDPKGFIHNTFITAKKKGLVDNCTNAPNISEARAAHSISAYFMGFILAEGLLKESTKNFCLIKNTSFEFSYVWFLTSLYHDFGYRYERNQRFVNQIYRSMSKGDRRCSDNYYHDALFHLRKSRQLSIKYSIWSVNDCHKDWGGKAASEKANDRQIMDYVKKNYLNLLCDGNQVCMPMRSLEVVGNYLNYRLLGDGGHRRIDHGICGGMAFYDRIIKNYLNEYENKRRHTPNISLLDVFYVENIGKLLRFALDQLIVFMYIADCIINHNIWKAPADKEKMYQHFKLESLIGNRFEKINFYKNPLLFILVMSDTLEPYKNFFAATHSRKSIDDIEYNANDVLSAFENFDISFLRDSKDKIYIQVPDELRSECEGKLSDMKDWIDICFEEEGAGFTITILK